MKTKSLLFALAFVAILAACNNKPKTDVQTKDSSSCACKDSGCCKKTDTIQYSKILAAKIYIKPDRINEFTIMFKSMTDSTLKEPGCTGYQLYQNPYDKNSFLVFETYKNQAAVETHFATSYFKAFGDMVGPLTSKATEIVIYDVANEKK